MLIDQLPEDHPQGEEMLQLLVKIVHFHATRHSTPASLARGILESAIAKYPNNTEFLSLYLWGEASGRVYGRIQRLVSDLTGENKGIVAMLWSVWSEAIGSARTFWDPRGGGAERVRRALDRSVNTMSGKRSAVLWTLYIEFEIMMGRPSSAKALCYRAIAAVGGCKGELRGRLQTDKQTSISSRSLQPCGPISRPESWGPSPSRCTSEAFAFELGLRTSGWTRKRRREKVARKMSQPPSQTMSTACCVSVRS